ncbi:MAG: F0F1 ATP synthase subunit delta [Rhodothermales bacterium]
MADPSIARRYAQALPQQAESENSVEQVDEDVELIRESLEGSRELVRFFESPVIPREKKDAVVQELFKDRLQPTTLHFLQLLIAKKREDLFPDVVRAYHDLRNKQLGIVEAYVKSAAELGDAETKRLETVLEERTGQQIRLHTTVDPDLIGGLVVRVGDTVYDGSVRHQLGVLREQLEQGTSVRLN